LESSLCCVHLGSGSSGRLCQNLPTRLSGLKVLFGYKLAVSLCYLSKSASLVGLCARLLLASTLSCARSLQRSQSGATLSIQLRGSDAQQNLPLSHMRADIDPYVIEVPAICAVSMAWSKATTVTGNASFMRAVPLVVVMRLTVDLAAAGVFNATEGSC
jgi:hypothetical protein